MPRTAQIFGCFVASPSDVAAEREVVRQTIFSWNSSRSTATETFVDPIMWETHATHVLATSPQELINDELLGLADFAIGVFWRRAGTPTGRAVGGAVEEIEYFQSQGAPVLVCFKEDDAEEAADRPDREEQEDLLRAFRARCETKGLVITFKDADDLQRKIAQQIERIVSVLEGDGYNYYTRKTGESTSVYDINEDRQRLEFQSDLTKRGDERCLARVVEVLEKERRPAPYTVLDVGCGHGVVTKSRFADAGLWDVTGIDLAEEAIRAAKKDAAAHFNFMPSDFIEYDPVDSFDVVFTSYVLHHVQDKDAFLAKLWGHVRPGGFLLIRTFDDGLTIRSPKDAELDFVFNAAQDMEGGSDRQHGRQLSESLLRLWPKYESLVSFVHATNSAELSHVERRRFFDFVFAFRPAYFRRLAQRLDAKPSDIAGYQRASRAVDDGRDRFVSDPKQFMLHAHMIWAVRKPL